MAGRTEVVQLHRGPYELEVCPGQGGCITAFRHRGRDLLRPATARYFADGDAREASSFPLVPFSNRVADARFGFLGQTYRLARNSPPEPHAIHGNGWQNPWAVAHATRSRAVLDFAHRSAGTPLDYRARQTLALGDRGLAVTLEIANAGASPMPAGLGLHPYFGCSEGSRSKRASITSGCRMRARSRSGGQRCRRAGTSRGGGALARSISTTVSGVGTAPPESTGRKPI